MTVKELLMEKEYSIKYYDQNIKQDLKESSLLNFMQDIATISAESHGFGPTYVFTNNYAWFLLKYHIEIYSSLRAADSVVLTTEPRGVNRLFAYRNFGIYNKNGKKIGAASSQWALIDMTAKKMLPIEKLWEAMPKYTKRDDDFDFEKIPAPEKVQCTKEFEVKFDDIDVNQHANNSNYIIWALETIPHEFRMKKNITTFDINYKKETTMGTKVISQVELFDSNTTIHLLKDAATDEELCSLKLVWQDED